ncbi:cellulose synthase [Rhizohabitans arisaemae]|uniref:cellulose synthase n=1 Tax=Rhizohabitans arisaemae TaxID=2720610 RepID=UPI0024B0AD44|nr:cellulose synthase [Rhizohabitans arisaemae]
MPSYEQIAWLPLCTGLTAVGLVLSWLALRRRGAAAGIRGAAWSLLPLAAYLTGAVALVWTVLSQAVSFVAGFVFSPVKWAGVVIAGLAAVLFVVSGVLRARRSAGAGPGKRAKAAPPAQPPAAGVTPGAQGAPKPVGPGRKPSGKAAADDDLSEIEEILRRRGIS